MLRYITVHLGAPFCGCRVVDLSHTIQQTVTGEIFLSIRCRSCNKSISIADEKIRVEFRFYESSNPIRPQNTKLLMQTPKDVPGMIASANPKELEFTTNDKRFLKSLRISTEAIREYSEGAD